MMKSVMLSMMLAANVASSVSAAEPVQSELGKGILLYDKDAGLKDECINFDAKAAVTEDVRTTTYQMTLVRNREELFDKISTSGSAKGSYGTFSAGAKSKFVKEVNWNYSSNYILVRATRVSQKQSVAQGTVLLKANALNIVRDSKFRFLETCGNAYATSIEMGGEVYGLIEIRSETYEQKQKIEASINGSGSYGLGSGSAKASYERTIRKLSADFKVKVEFQHIGGGAVQVPNTVEGLLEISNNIEALSDSFPVPLSMNTRDYTTLGNFPLDGDNIAVTIRQNQMDWAQGKLLLARNLYAQILYILENQGDFKRFDENSLKKKMGYLDEKIIQLKEFIALSASFTNNVDIKTLALDLDIDLPSMRNRAERNPLKVACETKPSLLCGVDQYREQKSSACGVVAPLEGTGPVCGTIYNEAPSPNCGVKAYKVNRGAECGVEMWQKCYVGPARFGRPRKHKRHPSCGVELYAACSHPNFGTEYNSCRDPQNGIEKFATCKHKDFGYEFSTCKHFSHGPDTYKACEVAKIGTQETYCPKF